MPDDREKAAAAAPLQHFEPLIGLVGGRESVRGGWEIEQQLKNELLCADIDNRQLSSLKL